MHLNQQLKAQYLLLLKIKTHYLPLPNNKNLKSRKNLLSYNQNTIRINLLISNGKIQIRTGPINNI